MPDLKDFFPELKSSRLFFPRTNFAIKIIKIESGRFYGGKPYSF